MTCSIRCYNLQHPVKPFSFYVLSKGLNSGKPLQNPCPNCFAVTCSNQEEQDFYYTLCFALWKSKSFEVYLTGSVIVFLRINDFKKILQQQEARLKDCNGEFLKTVTRVKLLEVTEANIRQQLHLLAQMKIALLRQCLK